MPLLDTTKNLLLGSQQVERAYRGSDLVWQRFTVSGGTETTANIGGQDYKVYTFTSSGTLTVIGEGEVDALIVAGGGGGGRADNQLNGGPGGAGGGGGAGGLLQQSSVSLSEGSYSIVVGTGGAQNVNGGNSSAFGFTAIGGGKGGSSLPDGTAASGGSGGGEGGEGRGIGTGTSGQGNNGGPRGTSGEDNLCGGSGGGANGAGNIGIENRAAGGAGLSLNFDGTTKTYATGGVGGSSSSGFFPAVVNGTDGLGEGGSGGTSSNTVVQVATQDGGSGGDGVVIVRVAV